jgi:ribosomal protein S6
MSAGRGVPPCGGRTDKVGTPSRVHIGPSILPCPTPGLPPRSRHQASWGIRREETRMMRAYEMMIIIDGDVDDPKAQAWMKTVTDGVSAAGGEIHGKIDWWGKRQFAYPINKKPSGYYMVAEIVAPGRLARRTRAHAPSRGRRRPSQAHPSARGRGRAPRHGSAPPPERSSHKGESTWHRKTASRWSATSPADPELRYTPAARGSRASGSPSTGATSRTVNGRSRCRSSTSSPGAISARTLPPASARACASSSPVGSSSASYETKEGEKRSVTEIRADELGPSLRWAQAQVERISRDDATAAGGGGGGGGAARPRSRVRRRRAVLTPH